MSKYFFDTSAIVKRYHREDGSDLIDRLFAESDAEFIISDISIIEPQKRAHSSQLALRGVGPMGRRLRG